jgi:uncharacterized membrane protein
MSPIKEISWWQALIAGVLFFVTIGSRKVTKWMGIDLDENKDGRTTRNELIPYLYFWLVAFVTIVEVVTPEERFTSWKFGALIAASFGVAVFQSYFTVKKPIEE